MSHRGLVVIGTSAGGIEALQQICRGFPSDLDAAVLVVIHTSSQSGGMLPRILSRSGPLPAVFPADGEAIEKGKIYVAPPDRHMIAEDGHLRVVAGPRENRHRPAIDPTFRSVAKSYGRRAIGVILTGSLDDGTSGLMMIHAHGGEAVVQDPTEAMFPDMPTNALCRVPDARVAKLERLPALITELVAEPLDQISNTEIKEKTEYVQKTANAEFHMAELETEIRSGKPSQFACPECGGVLWEIDQQGLLRFRCRVGHAYTAMNLSSEQRLAVETALWAALRALEESASLYQRMADRAQSAHQDLSYTTFMERADGARTNSTALRDFLIRLGGSETELEAA